MAKINRVRRMINRIEPECDLEVDGGSDPENARLCVAAGGNVLVVGSAVFGNRSRVQTAMEEFRAAALD